MARELIVSVNGREKKIAIIEDERVTEFYIERGEENQGIVGNIYKGRVMRVLPGMQSAFVDIGLDRDAFLYVSDFFDEEEEFERIVVDKSKKVDAETAARDAAEQIHLARVERERVIEATHERAEPLREAEPGAIITEEVTDEPEEETPAEATAEVEPAETGTRRRGRRGRRRGRGADETHDEATSQGAATSLPESDGIETPFIVPDSSFERVVDEDELAAAENGAMFKDARLQERIFDQIHAVEFDMDDVSSAEVGTILPSADLSDSSFQRVDDSDFESGGLPASKIGQPRIEAHVAGFVDDVIEESPRQSSFERVSDDEPAAEAQADDVELPQAPAKRKSRGGVTKKVASALSRITKKPAPKKEKETESEENATESGDADLAATSNDGEAYPDSEASVTTGRIHEEFATRRGGRRRRKPSSRPAGTGEEGATNGQDETAEAAPEVDDQPEEVAAVEPKAAEKSVPESSSSARAPRGGSREERPSRGRGAHRSSRRDHQQPAITDLLREGQEILVQIAKEPIAKKGARITSHIALPGRFLVYMPTVEHVGVSRKIESDSERTRLRKLIQIIRAEEDVPSGGFIVRTAGIGISEADLREDARYLVRTWLEIRKNAEKAKPASMVHKDLDLVQRILRDQLSEDFTAIRVDDQGEYERVVEFVNRVQPRMVKRVKLYTRDEPILEAFNVQGEIDKAIKPRVWLKSGGYLVINQTEALVAIDVNTGKFVGRGGSRLEDTITRTNLEAVDEIVRQIRLRDLGGIIVLDLIDMEERRNRTRVMQVLQDALQGDKSPTKVLSFNDFGLVIMTRKRVKQSLERTLCSPCDYCQGAGLVKSPQTICYEILDQARRLGKEPDAKGAKGTTLRVNPEVYRALHGPEKDVLAEIEEYLGAVDVTSDGRIHQEQFDFAIV
ncbi:MAG: ribonuclease [Blastocatellia bacterium]|jgi:ribonuclease G|nr:ribonuclease [Blastocatellia bacterium]